jgi:hypothetical protein
VPEVTRRRPDAQIEPSEVRELRARIGQQAEVIDELRREVGWLIEELLGKEPGGIGTEAPEAVDDDGLPAGWRPMLHAMRRLVYRHLPQRSRLAVVSSGVEPLLRFAGYSAEHLSQDRFGQYTDCHPSCGRVAVVQVEAARWRGAEFLLIPHSELWWLDHYPEFAAHLGHYYARFAEDGEGGAIWDLRTPGPQRAVHELLAGLCTQVDHRPALLDWGTGHDLTARFDGYKVFSPLGAEPVLPYVDGSVDVVALGDGTLEHASEAVRVASSLVIHVASDSDDRIDVLWRANATEERTDGVSIAVATSDGRTATAGFVDRLLETLPVSFAGEVLVDAACVPAPRTARSRRHPRTRVVRCPTGDDVRARLGRCARAASGDVLVVVDALTWPTPGWLPPLIRPLRDRDVGFVTGRWAEPDGRLLAYPSPGGSDVSAGRDRLDAPRHTRVRRLGETRTGFFATRRRLLLEWDETSSPSSDVSQAYSASVAANGGVVLYEPEAIAISAADPVSLGLEQSNV